MWLGKAERPAAAGRTSPSAGPRTKHVMMSYNWDHQPTIKRVVAALQAAGFNVWLDVQQMRGSTVDAMSKAVEDASIMLLGVSQAYKESSNCRCRRRPVLATRALRSLTWVPSLENV